MAFTETESIELKEKLNENFIKVVVSFLNTREGTIYIGVKDNGDIIGVPNTDKALQEIADIITMQILPNPQELVEIGTRYIDCKSVLEIKVKKGKSLYYIKKYGRSAAGCYVRVGSTSRSMSEEQIEKRYIATLSVPKRTMKEERSPRQDLTFNQFKTLLEFKKVHYSPSGFEKNFNLRNSEEQYNYIAFLVSDQNDTSIKVVRFSGLTKAEFISRKEFETGCIFKQMDEALDFSLNVLNIVQTNIVGAVRVDTPYFDKDAFREAWYNAVCHNLWVEQTPPAIYGFDDRVEIISHGLLVEGLSEEDFFNGVSKPVNEEFAKIFIQMHYMEQSGRGVPTVIKQYGRQVYTFGTSFIQCIIPYNILDKAKHEKLIGADKENDGVNPGNEGVNPKNDGVNPGNDGVNPENDSVKLSKTAKAVLDCLSSDNTLSAKNLALKTGKSIPTIERTLKKLKEVHLLERVGSDKTGHWKILK